MVVTVVSLRDGQDTRAISFRTWPKNRNSAMHAAFTFSSIIKGLEANQRVPYVMPISRHGVGTGDCQSRKPAVEMAGAEGLEPSTLGFGDRCSTN